MQTTTKQHQPFLVSARFAALNKQNTLDEYEYETERDSQVERVEITEVLSLTDAEYDDFADNFLRDDPRIAGKGGTSSTADLPEVASWTDYTDEQQQAFREHAYREVILVRAPGRRTLFVDPAGYEYARYVGFPEVA